MASDIVRLTVIHRGPQAVCVRVDALQGAGASIPATRRFALALLQELAPPAPGAAVPWWHSTVPGDVAAFTRAALDQIAAVRMPRAESYPWAGPHDATLPSVDLEIEPANAPMLAPLEAGTVVTSTVFPRGLERAALSPGAPSPKECLAQMAAWRPKKGAPAVLGDAEWTTLTAWLFHRTASVVKRALDLALCFGEAARRVERHAAELVWDEDPEVCKAAIEFFGATRWPSAADVLGSRLAPDVTWSWPVLNALGRLEGEGKGRHTHLAAAVARCATGEHRTDERVDWTLWRCSGDADALARWATSMIAHSDSSYLINAAPPDAQPALVCAVVAAIKANPRAARRSELMLGHAARGLADPAPLRAALKALKAKK